MVKKEKETDRIENEALNTYLLWFEAKKRG